ncbi:hypothetical protein A2U01_0110005, partial [Trifolium medium]|nr:hypothetical protein [Trifolium medium]
MGCVLTAIRNGPVNTDVVAVPFFYLPMKKKV